MLLLPLPLRPGQRPGRVGGEPQERGRGPARTDMEVGATHGTEQDRQAGRAREAAAWALAGAGRRRRCRR